MTRSLLITIIVIAAIGCDDCRWERDLAQQQRIFKECMAALPKGPITTHYNDWDEVVGECRSVAYWQSESVKKCYR